MQVQYALWDNLVKEIKKDIPGFEVVHKKDVILSKLIAKILFFTNYMQFYTTRYPKIYLPNKNVSQQYNPRSLQHEWVHLKDQQTFFGLFPFLPAKVNWFLFAIAYLMPQLFALLALLAFWNPWWLVCLAFIAPLPSPARMIAEMRAFRRTRELGIAPDALVDRFVKSTYYFVWPFKKHVRKMLMKDSPYKAVMDQSQEL